MLRFVLFLSLIFVPNTTSKKKVKIFESESKESDDFGGKLINGLRDDRNLDLSVDDDYEDLRAELLAYHTALATLANRTDALPPSKSPSRRSMKSTPCWQRGGICVHFKLCTGFNKRAEVLGCRHNLEVCCFAWNKFQISDYKDKGIGNMAMPWSLQHEFGGKGIISPFDSTDNEKQISVRVDDPLKRFDKYKSKNQEEISKENSPPLVVVVKDLKKK